MAIDSQPGHKASPGQPGSAGKQELGSRNAGKETAAVAALRRDLGAYANICSPDELRSLAREAAAERRNESRKPLAGLMPIPATDWSSENPLPQYEPPMPPYTDESGPPAIPSAAIEVVKGPDHVPDLSILPGYLLSESRSPKEDSGDGASNGGRKPTHSPQLPAGLADKLTMLRQQLLAEGTTTLERPVSEPVHSAVLAAAKREKQPLSWSNRATVAAWVQGKLEQHSARILANADETGGGNVDVAVVRQWGFDRDRAIAGLRRDGTSALERFTDLANPVSRGTPMSPRQIVEGVSIARALAATPEQVVKSTARLEETWRTIVGEAIADYKSGVMAADSAITNALERMAIAANKQTLSI